MPAEVWWPGHATVVLELDGARLVTDPVIRGRVGPLVRIGTAVAWPPQRHVDAVLLSHLHADHADPASLRRVVPRVVVAPRGSRAWLRRHGAPDVRELEAGEEIRIGSVRVRAVPAVHDGRRHRLGPRAAPIGFVVAGSRSVYFAGDTDLFGGMADLGPSLDAALLPVWGWGPGVGPGHLDPSRAARAAALIRPRVAIPIHWGTLALPRLLRRGAGGEAPARRFAALLAREAPDVEARVLRLGERTVV